MRRVFSPHHGHAVIVGGRKRPTRSPNHARVHLAKYMKHAELEPAPDCDYSAGALGLANVLGNNTLGDCTCAGVGHAIEVINAAAGSPLEVTTAEVIALYSAACGYKPGDASTDQGGDEFSVLDYMCERGLDGAGKHRFFGSAVINGADKEEVRLAQYLFTALYFGEEMPDDYVSPFPSGIGFTWGVGGDPNPSNGHCFIGYGSTSEGIKIDTWGMFGVHTYDAIAKYAVSVSGGELHVPLSRELINAASQKSPTGLAWEDLVADLERLGGLAA
jgi:hypothetical protein